MVDRIKPIRKLPFKSTKIGGILGVPAKILIIEPKQAFQVKFNRVIVSQLNRELKRIAPLVEEDFKNTFKAVFRDHPTFKSLGGTEPRGLDAHFGFPKGTAPSVVDQIIFTLSNSVTVRPIRVSRRRGKPQELTGGLELTAVRADFQDLLGLPEGHVTTKKGKDLWWMRWLLIRGNSLIVKDYSITFGYFPLGTTRSQRIQRRLAGHDRRSEKAIMVYTKELPQYYPDATSGWKVPSEHAGVYNDNFITRAIDEKFKFIQKIFQASVERHLL